MKITKKLIFDNTRTFIGIMAFIIVFTVVFGFKNILIGITTITAMLMLLERDLTIHPVANTMKLITLNIFIGVMAFLTIFNIWLAIPINFIAMFAISYLLIFNLKNPLYFPFSLQYIFLLAMPAGISEMPMRLLALLVGAMAIMAIQLVKNRNRVQQTGEEKIKTIAEGLQTKIVELKEDADFTESHEQITADISSLRNVIYDRREEDFYLTNEGQIKLNISAAFEKINLVLTDEAKSEPDPDILDDMRECLYYVLNSFDESKSSKQFDAFFTRILSKYSHKENKSLFVLQLLNNIDTLRGNILSLNELDTSRYNVAEKVEQIPNKFKKWTFGNTPRHSTSIKFSYAFRIALAVSIGAFIGDYFELSEGRWILVTVLSVIVPIYEQSTKKMRDRILATIVGAISVGILFTIIQDTIGRAILLTIAGYLMNYAPSYRSNITFVTFSAIGSAALLTNTEKILTVERLALVLLGVVLALVINRFVFQYKENDANEDLEEMYEDTLTSMLKELKDKFDDKPSNDSINNFLMITNMIEDRIKLNTQKQHIDWLYRNRITASSIYELYDWVDRHGMTEDMAEHLSDYMTRLIDASKEGFSDETLISNLKEETSHATETEKQIIWSLMTEIATELDFSVQEETAIS